jgi:WhiB family redox-sensing transcriptional regulator
MGYDWRDDANCAGTDTSVFFHPEGERGAERTERENSAKRICRGCPVRAECLDEAFTKPHEYGTFGGMSERERRNIRGRRTLKIQEYLRLRDAGVPAATAAAVTSAPPETEAAVNA